MAVNREKAAIFFKETKATCDGAIYTPPKTSVACDYISLDVPHII